MNQDDQQHTEPTDDEPIVSLGVRHMPNPVTTAYLERRIASEWYFTANDGVLGAQEQHDGLYQAVRHGSAMAESQLRRLTLCVLILDNEFPVLGHSYCDDPKTFDAEDERRRARADATAKAAPMLQFAERTVVGHGFRLQHFVTPPLSEQLEDDEVFEDNPYDPKVAEMVRSLRAGLTEALAPAAGTTRPSPEAGAVPEACLSAKPQNFDEMYEFARTHGLDATKALLQRYVAEGQPGDFMPGIRSRDMCLAAGAGLDGLAKDQVPADYRDTTHGSELYFDMWDGEEGRDPGI